MAELENKPQDGALLIDPSGSPSQERETLAHVDPPDDGKADVAADLLQDVLDRMALEADVGIRDDDEQIVLDVSGPDAGRAIGKKGQTLDALQFLVNKIVNRFPEGRRHVIVDSGDYRERHDRHLTTRARREAKRVMQEGSVVTLEPMNARDRRVIHLSLAKFDGVETCSEGEGMQRRIQICPTEPKRRARQ